MNLYYLTLLDLFKTQQLPFEKVNALFPVYSSILNQFLDFNGLSLGSLVGDELFDDTKLGLFFESLNGKYGPSSIPGMKSKLRKIRDHAIRISINSKIKNLNFAETLSFILKGQDMSGTALAEKLNMRPCTITNWISGKINPSFKSMDVVRKIEKLLDLPAMTLTEKLGKVVHGQKVAAVKARERSEVGIITSNLRKYPYSLSKKKFPEKITLDLKDFGEFHTCSFMAGIHQNFKRKKDHQFWEIKDGVSGREKTLIKDYSEFLGFLVSPATHKDDLCRGMDIPIDKLSIVCLLNKDFISGYVSFREKRVGKLTTGIERILIFISSCSQEKYGYLRQRFDLGKEFFRVAPDGTFEYPYSPQMTEEEWKKKWNEICDDTHEYVEDFLNSSVFESLVDPSAPIQEMIERNEVLKEVKEMLDWMKYDANIPGIAPYHKAQKKRDFLLVLLVFLFELRIDHYSKFELDKHFFKRDSKWFFRVFKKELKNPKVLKTSHVTLEIPLDVGELIDDYLKNYRHFFYGAETSKRFFLGSVTGRKTEVHDGKVQTRSLAAAFKSATIVYANNKTGYSPHAVRKIVTFVLDKKRDLSDYDYSAPMALHSRQTSRDSYSPDQVQTAFRFHVKQLQRSGILMMPENEGRKILVDETEYNTLVMKVRELELERIKEKTSDVQEDDQDFLQ